MSIDLMLFCSNLPVISAKSCFVNDLLTIDNSGEPLIANHQNFTLKFNVKFL